MSYLTHGNHFLSHSNHLGISYCILIYALSGLSTDNARGKIVQCTYQHLSSAIVLARQQVPVRYSAHRPAQGSNFSQRYIICFCLIFLILFNPYGKSLLLNINLVVQSLVKTSRLDHTKKECIPLVFIASFLLHDFLSTLILLIQSVPICWTLSLDTFSFQLACNYLSLLLVQVSLPYNCMALASIRGFRLTRSKTSSLCHLALFQMGLFHGVLYLSP